MLNKIVTSPKRVYEVGKPQGLCSWGASLHPRLQVSLAHSFHWLPLKNVLPGCLNTGNKYANWKEDCAVHFFPPGESDERNREASSFRMSKWKPRNLSPVTAGLIPGSNQLHLFIHIEHRFPFPPLSAFSYHAALLCWDHLLLLSICPFFSGSNLLPCSSFKLFLLYYLSPGSCFWPFCLYS